MAQLTIIVLLVLIPFAVIPSVDLLLSKIFAPVTEEAVFGLIKHERMNPNLSGAQDVARWVAVILSLSLGIYLYLRHIPAALEHARKMVADKILQADQLVSQRPSESILLYNAAREWSVDEDSESELANRLDRINAMIHSADGATDARPDQTAVIPTGVHEPGATVVAGRYRIEEQLGSGAMGIVYLAEDSRLKRKVALKQLAPQHSANEQLLARFRQEALALARLSHSNIVQVYDLVEGQGFLWIAMEFVAGRDLEGKLKGPESLDLKEIVRLATQMAAALGYAHDRGVIHRDFKPANVLITTSGDAKITDFGIAKLTQSSLHTQVNTVMGSPAYMSPEQASGDETDQRTDIYALGIVLYQMLCGELPFQGDAKSIISQHLAKTPPSLRAKHEAIPTKLDEIVQKMLAKDPAERYQSMAEVVGQLNDPF